MCFKTTEKPLPFPPLPSAQNNAAEERKREKKPLYSTSSSLLLRFLPSAPYQSKSEEGGKGLFLTREKGEEEGCTKKAAAVGTELGIPPAKREKGGGEPQLRQGRRRFAKGVGAEGKGGKRPRLAERQKDKEERQTVAFRPFRRCLRCIKDRQKA